MVAVCHTSVRPNEPSWRLPPGSQPAKGARTRGRRGAAAVAAVAGTDTRRRAVRDLAPPPADGRTVRCLEEGRGTRWLTTVPLAPSMHLASSQTIEPSSDRFIRTVEAGLFRPGRGCGGCWHRYSAVRRAGERHSGGALPRRRQPSRPCGQFRLICLARSTAAIISPAVFVHLNGFAECLLCALDLLDHRRAGRVHDAGTSPL